MAMILLMISARGCLFAGPLWNGGLGHWGVGNLLWGTGLFGVGWILFAAIAIWVGIDARNRGSNGLLWGLFVFFAPVIGLVVYLILVTTREEGVAPGAGMQWANKHPCARCGTAIQTEFKVCPYCGHSQRCGSCDRPLQAGWKVCPFCGAEVTGPDPTSS